MKSFTLQYAGHPLEVDIHSLSGSATERNFDLTVRGSAELSDETLDGLLDYLHKEGFFDLVQPAPCYKSSEPPQ